MASTESDQMAEFFANVAARTRVDLDPVTRRDILERMHLCGTEPEGVTYAEVDAGGVPAMWCIPADYDEDSVLMWNHAGGSVVFSMHSDRKLAGHLAKAAGVRALVVDFRRSPENKFPAQQDDVETAYRWLRAQGFKPESIVSGGHSIGGNLAVSLALRLRDLGEALPAAVLTVAAWFDIELTNKSLETNAATDKSLTVPLMKFFRECWLGGTGTAYDDPRVNPLHADLNGLPPLNVYYGAYEILAGGVVEFANRAKAAGLDVALHSVPQGQHLFLLGAGRVPETNTAIAQMGNWVRSKLGLAAQPAV
jgi:monoterpene epsilon-lactone hydrolase